MQSQRIGWVSVTDFTSATMKIASTKESLSLHVIVGCRIHFFFYSKFIHKQVVEPFTAMVENQKENIGDRMWWEQLYCMCVRERPEIICC